jgi:hypothetical protein
MPVLGLETALPITIGDLAKEVILRCENRQQEEVRAYSWLRDTLLELTTHTDYRDDFDELETWGEPFLLTSGLGDYPFDSVLPLSTDPVTGGAITSYNMATLSVILWTDPGTNKRSKQLNPSHYQAVDRRASYAPGVPNEWYRFGDTITFDPVPNNNYQIRARILRMHPINDDALQLTPILIGRDWHDILTWGAVERGYMEAQEFDKAAGVHSLLHGDPRHPDKPGLLKGAKTRRKREAWRRTGSLRVTTRSYGRR